MRTKLIHGEEFHKKDWIKAACRREPDLVIRQVRQGIIASIPR